jgi:hypothetical protein
MGKYLVVLGVNVSAVVKECVDELNIAALRRAVERGSATLRGFR